MRDDHWCGRDRERIVERFIGNVGLETAIIALSRSDVRRHSRSLTIAEQFVLNNGYGQIVGGAGRNRTDE